MEIIPITCHFCGKTTDKPKKEYDRQRRKGRECFYCSISCSTKDNLTIHHPIKSTCLWCKNEFSTTTHSNAHKCCSDNCARKYAQSFVDKKKLSVSMKKAWVNGSYDNAKFPRVLTPRVYNFTCVICNQPFQRITKKIIAPIKTCSEKCFGKLVSKWTRNNPNCGGKLGYRKFKYNGFSMDSRWEVELAKWMDGEGIKWDRSRKRHMFIWVDENGDKRKYFPDFYLPNLNIYLDPKNDYYLQRDLPKLKYVMNAYNVKIFYGGVENIKKDIDKIRV